MGVLCEVAGIPRTPYGYEFDGNEEREVLPDSYLAKIDLDEDVASALMGLNDEGRSFKFIAEYIEEQV